MRNLLLIITSITFTAIGQLLLKYGMSKFGPVGGRAIFTRLDEVFIKPHILLGLAAFILSFVLWLAVLSKNDLSYAYPMVSFSYVVVVFGSAWLFHEHINIWKVIGVILVCLGVSFIAQTPHKTVAYDTPPSASPSAGETVR